MKVIGISSGMGVSLYPFKEHVVGNVEPRAIFHTKKNEQWAINFGEIPLEKTVEDLWVRHPWPVDLLISSPDCGNGSILRLSVAKTYGDYKNNPSLEAFFKGVEMFSPKVFYFENLEKFFESVSEVKFLKKIKDYRIVKLIAPVSHWGNSQINRKRLIIIGLRNDIPLKVDKEFKLPHLQELNQTCTDLYGDLDNLDAPDRLRLGHVREDLMELTTIHSGRKISNGEITRTWREELKGERRWKVVGRKYTTAPGVYRNRKNDYPATARRSSRQYDHRGLMLTPRQLARIQGVPDDFGIYIDPKRLNYWLNKGRALITKTPPMEISIWLKYKILKLQQKTLL